MDEDFLDVTESSKKTGIIFILLILVIAVCGYFFVFKRFHFTLRTVEVELGSEVSSNVEDYISKSDTSDLKDFKLDLSAVTKDEIGEYTYKVTYKKITKKGTLRIVDTTPPKFTLKPLTLEATNESVYFGSFLEECSDYSTPCLVTLKNSSDEGKFATPGTYSIELEISDIYGNKSTGVASLTIVAEGTLVDEASKDLEYASNSEGIENFDGPIYEKLDKALAPDSDEASDKIADVSSARFDEYVLANYPNTSIKEIDIIRLFNKHGYIIGFSVKLTLGDKQEIYVKKENMPNIEDDTASE